MAAHERTADSHNPVADRGRVRPARGRGVESRPLAGGSLRTATGILKSGCPHVTRALRPSGRWLHGAVAPLPQRPRCLVCATPSLRRRRSRQRTHAHRLVVLLPRLHPPGVATSAALLLPLIRYLLVRVVRERLVPAAFLLPWLVLAVVQPLGAALSGSSLSVPQLALQRLGARLGEWLWGAA